MFLRAINILDTKFSWMCNYTNYCLDFAKFLALFVVEPSCYTT
jgi:hypothetical protein